MSEPSLPTHPAPRGWAQFSLKTLMLLMLLVAAFFGGLAVALRKSQEAEEMARHEAKMARLIAIQAEQKAVVQQMLSAQARQRLNGAAVPAENAAAEIEAVLRLQAEAWNAGQIDRFMEHYWKSDELTFSAGGETTRGWQNTLDRYRERYPTIEKMGRLTFDQLEVQPLGDAAALVLGRWRLARVDDALGGNFSLITRKIDGRWLIVHDHTSRSEPPRSEPPPQRPAGEMP